MVALANQKLLGLNPVSILVQLSCYLIANILLSSKVVPLNEVLTPSDVTFTSCRRGSMCMEEQCLSVTH